MTGLITKVRAFQGHIVLDRARVHNTLDRSRGAAYRNGFLERLNAVRPYGSAVRGRLGPGSRYGPR